MKKYTIILLIASLQVSAQDLYTISLDKHVMDTSSISFRIAEVIDGRKDRNVIGLVQLGLNNRKEFAVFKKKGLGEIEGLLKRSGLAGTDTRSLVVRVTRLYISELTLALSETAKAELALDFFIKKGNDQYRYVSSFYASEEHGSIEVTGNHEANIVKVFEKAFRQLSSDQFVADLHVLVSYSDLADPDIVFRDVSSMPLMQAEQYKDGFYASFEEFVNDNPSINIDCKIRIKRGVRMQCNGREEDVAIYGFARNNELFILFYKRFYKLKKERGSFYFEGPRMPGQTSAYAKGWIMAGALGGAIAQATSGYNVIYKVDLNTGAIKVVTGIY